MVRSTSQTSGRHSYSCPSTNAWSMAKTISTIAERNIAAEDSIINLKVKVKVKVGKFLSLHGTHPTLDRSTTLRDVADEPRIMIMFISLPGTKRWLSARWEATTSSASSEDEEHCITYVIACPRDRPTTNKHKQSFSNVAPNGTHSKPQPIESRVIGRNLNRNRRRRKCRTGGRSFSL